MSRNHRSHSEKKCLETVNYLIIDDGKDSDEKKPQEKRSDEADISDEKFLQTVLSICLDDHGNDEDKGGQDDDDDDGPGDDENLQGRDLHR